MEGKKSSRFEAQILIGTLKKRLACSSDENLSFLKNYQILDIYNAENHRMLVLIILLGKDKRGGCNPPTPLLDPPLIPHPSDNHVEGSDV